MKVVQERRQPAAWRGAAQDQHLVAALKDWSSIRHHLQPGPGKGGAIPKFVGRNLEASARIQLDLNDSSHVEADEAALSMRVPFKQAAHAPPKAAQVWQPKSDTGPLLAPTPPGPPPSLPHVPQFEGMGSQLQEGCDATQLSPHRELSAVEEWEARVAAPRRAARAAKAAVHAKELAEAGAAAARSAEVAALAHHGNASWRSIGKCDAVQTLHSLQLFVAEEKLSLKSSAKYLDGIKVSPRMSSSPLLTRRRAAIDAFVASRRV